MTTPTTGEQHELEITRMAHGGEGIATLDGRVVFVRGAYPGDRIRATVTEVKKNFARAGFDAVLQASPLRVEQRCPAAAQGAGCCDFGDLAPERELELKHEILQSQLQRIAKLTELPPTDLVNLAPHTGWRTRMRLGVDADGRAGLRAARSNDLITSVGCSQAVPGLLDGVIGEGARTFTPGAEVIVVLDSEGNRHVVESRRAARGRRTEQIVSVVEGNGDVVQEADGHRFTFPATAFWQAHVDAPDAYTTLVRNWLGDLSLDTGGQPVAWDLYGGVGLFVPALADSLGADAAVHSVELSPAAARAGQETLADYDVTFHNARVEQQVTQLPQPAVVLLDPPRTGAGAKVIETLVAARPQAVVHIGCDPATFSRDVAAWAAGGYALEKMTVFNAFPGTHHFEVIGLLRPAE